MLGMFGGAMGQYSVPEEIRKLKPKGTMVKKISGHYYVYEFSNYVDESGKRHTKMGKMIGKIKEGIGFIPKGTGIRESEISTVDYGEYAITMQNTKHVLHRLMDCFNAEDATTIYIVSLIHFLHGFTYLRDIKAYYEMSYLSVQYPSLNLSYEALGKLYDSLGRRQNSVLNFEKNLLEESSHQIAIDGHVIGSDSTENDLSEKGYKFNKLGEPQMNLLMAYDVNTCIPLMSKIYEGASSDKISIRDFLNQVELKDMLFILDRGFYSAENIKLLSNNGNQYIIPLGKNIAACKKAVSSLDMQDRFMYQKGKKASVVEYKDEKINGVRILTYRDLNISAAEQENYLRHMAKGDPAFTKEGLEQTRLLMGVSVLQTSMMDKTPYDIYVLYKKRWTIETYFNYFKNQAGYSCLHSEDYYKTQGLAFIMLVSSLIHQEMHQLSKSTGLSLQDCLLTARMVKANKRNGCWVLANCLKRQLDLFDVFNVHQVELSEEHT